MATMKIKKGDMVKVIAGKDKDKEGKVITVLAKNGKVLVEGVNMVTKHAKPSVSNQQDTVRYWHSQNPDAAMSATAPSGISAHTLLHRWHTNYQSPASMHLIIGIPPNQGYSRYPERQSLPLFYVSPSLIHAWERR